MKRLVCFLLLVGSAWAADFGTVTIEKGYVGPVVVDVKMDGVARNVTSATGTVTVYSSAPTSGVGGKTLFAKTLTPVGTPTNRFTFDLVAADLKTPGSYYVEIAVIEGGVRDPIHGTLVVDGR